MANEDPSPSSTQKSFNSMAKQQKIKAVQDFLMMNSKKNKFSEWRKQNVNVSKETKADTTSNWIMASGKPVKNVLIYKVGVQLNGFMKLYMNIRIKFIIEFSIII